jgi:hypothetical protein
LIALAALAFAGFSLLGQGPTVTPLTAQLVPEDELDRSWGTYLSEREWGTPREAVDGNGWGLDWEGAIDADYVSGDDGIGGISDAESEFRLSWAFWDGEAPHVTERLNGDTNPAGASGEDIREDRVFGANGPRHAYTHMTYMYPSVAPDFRIELESARFDSTSMTLVASVTNTTSDPRTLDVVLRGAVASGERIDSIEHGVLLHGNDSVVAVVANEPSSWQITSSAAALDTNLRGAGLTGGQGGDRAAIAYRLEIAAGAESVIRVGVAEASTVIVPLNGVAADPLAAATSAAQDALEASDAIVSARLTEAEQLFRGRVTEHESLYRAALSSLLWSESYYRWDGTTSIDPAWAGRVDAHDVLIMPDKWEYPWIASWDTAFQAVTASLADPEIAQDQLRFILSDRWQQPDGHIPCAEWVMDRECPPVMAWAVARVYAVSHDRDFLEEVYPALQKSYEYWWSHNQVGNGLFTGGFLGMDNLPRSGTGPQADATAWMAKFAADMAGIASELRDTAASDLYFSDRGRIQAALNAAMWDDDTGFYYDLTTNGSFIKHKSYTGLIPLIAGVVPPDRLPSVLTTMRDEAQLMSVGGIRSMAADDAVYVAGEAGRGINSNWRGPVWVPINYMLIEALADVDPDLAADIRDRVVSNIERDWTATSRFHEYFDGDTGEGLGADFQTGWTALVANLIEEGWPAPTVE